MSTNIGFWEPIVGREWYLNNQELFDSEYMGGLLNAVATEYAKGTIFPLQKDIFKAFRFTPFDKVRVVILGQDPYSTGTNTEPHATGLAFANPVDTINVNPSLKNIHRAVELHCYNGLKVHFDITLEEWAQQGVLLLNTSLTVNKYKPGSHSHLWDGFTRYIIESLSKQKTGLHFVFWGDHAKAYEYLVNGMFHYKYEYTHPARAIRVGEDWNCTHFKDINFNIIGQNGTGEAIAW